MAESAEHVPASATSEPPLPAATERRVQPNPRAAALGYGVERRLTRVQEVLDRSMSRLRLHVLAWASERDPEVHSWIAATRQAIEAGSIDYQATPSREDILRMIEERHRMVS